VADRGLSVSGRVVDAAGEPVARVDVGLRHEESGAPAECVTDDDGRFTATGLVRGAYRVRMRRAGAEVVELGTVDAGATEVTLRPRD
jgi:protocatechuate 3,4-dioxygenase beta subunit